MHEMLNRSKVAMTLLLFERFHPPNARVSHARSRQLLQRDLGILLRQKHRSSSRATERAASSCIGRTGSCPLNSAGAYSHNLD